MLNGNRFRVVYVLDTNTLIYFFKGMGKIAENLLRVPPAEIGIPTIVLFELETGIAKSNSPKKRAQQLAEICALVNILPFERKAAAESVNIRAQLEKKGTPIGPYDVLIAGVARSTGGTLVTRNSTEFGRVSGLKLENWF